MAHYSEMLMNVQESIMSAAKGLIEDIETSQNGNKSTTGETLGDEMYSEEQCKSANAEAGVLPATRNENCVASS